MRTNLLVSPSDEFRRRTLPDHQEVYFLINNPDPNLPNPLALSLLQKGRVAFSTAIQNAPQPSLIFNADLNELVIPDGGMIELRNPIDGMALSPSGRLEYWYSKGSLFQPFGQRIIRLIKDDSGARISLLEGQRMETDLKIKNRMLFECLLTILKTLSIENLKTILINNLSMAQQIKELFNTALDITTQYVLLETRLPPVADLITMGSGNILAARDAARRCNVQLRVASPSEAEEIEDLITY